MIIHVGKHAALDPFCDQRCEVQSKTVRVHRLIRIELHYLLTLFVALIVFTWCYHMIDKEYDVVSLIYGSRWWLRLNENLECLLLGGY